jgi:hypothetical protein
MRNGLFFAAMLLLTTAALSAQNLSGLRLDNYSGSQGIQSNPTRGLELPANVRWDATLAGASMFFQNNIGFVSNTGLLGLASSNGKVGSTLYSTQSVDSLYADVFNKTGALYLNGQAQILGPAFVLNHPEGFAFGVFANSRSFISSEINSDANLYTISRTQTFKQHTISTLNFKAAWWNEYGINFAKSFETDQFKWGLGGNLKILQSLQGAYGLVLTPTTITNPETGLSTPNAALITPTNLEIAYTRASQSNVMRTSGLGVGLDLGVNIMIADPDDDEAMKFKAGFAITDIGGLNFGTDAIKHNISTNRIDTLVRDQLSSAKGVDALFDTLYSKVLTDINTHSTTSGFSMGLPTTFRLNAEYFFTPRFSIAGQISQGIKLSNTALYSGNSMVVMPQYTSKWFSAQMPISLYNFSEIGIGASLKLGYLSIGTDNLMSLIGKQSQFTGMDFYVAIKIFPFPLSLDGLSGGGGPKRKGKAMGCYQF